MTRMTSAAVEASAIWSWMVASNSSSAGLRPAVSMSQNSACLFVAAQPPTVSSMSNASEDAVRRAIDLSERMTVALCDKHGSNPAIRDTTLLYMIIYACSFQRSIAATTTCLAASTPANSLTMVEPGFFRSL